jgi:hypothetical protein
MCLSWLRGSGTRCGVLLDATPTCAAAAHSQLKGEVVNRKFIIAWIVLFVAWFLGDFVIHGVLLHADYVALTNLYRSDGDAQGYFPIMMLAHAIMAGAFVWIYARGVESKPWVAQGVRFGVATALLTVVPMYLIYYAVQPVPVSLVERQIVFASILSVLLALIVAWLYRSRSATT